MNFSNQIKNEILNFNWNKKEQDVIFYISLFLLIKTEPNLNIILRLNNREILKFLYLNLKKINNKKYFLNFSEEQNKIFFDYAFFSVLKNNFLKLKEIILNDKNLHQSFLAALFLIKGSINNFAAKNNYLEIRVNKINYYQIYKLFYKINNKLTFKFNLTAKNNRFYLKKAIYIADFLKYIKATDSLIDFEENRIIKDMNLNLKRAEVIEKFNKTKITKNSTKQIEAIMIAFKNINYLNKLTLDQINLAKLRIKYHDSSLEDLKYYFYTNYRKNISKATINNWLKKIEKMTKN
ncbi:MAG: hypothetical protein HPPSJP_3980 [Candidatus Hepatoplasma scabrum]|nr:MAG: hypothetical protein HPPSJP_3980 [Candidatus Hepatoplasma sp.]